MPFWFNKRICECKAWTPNANAIFHYIPSPRTFNIVSNQQPTNDNDKTGYKTKGWNDWHKPNLQFGPKKEIVRYQTTLYERIKRKREREREIRFEFRNQDSKNKSKFYKISICVNSLDRPFTRFLPWTHHRINLHKLSIAKDPLTKCRTQKSGKECNNNDDEDHDDDDDDKKRFIVCCELTTHFEVN